MNVTLQPEARIRNPAPTQAPPRRGFSGFHRSLVLGALARLPLGRLELECPDGSRHVFGSADALPRLPAEAPAAAGVGGTAVIRVRRDAFFGRCVLRGDIGFAESYMDGDWETPDLPAVVGWFILNIESAPTLSGSRARAAGLNLLRWASRARHLMRPNSRRTAARNVGEHYDLSNEFFSLWLDPSLMYSCARWGQGIVSLEEAQREKNESLCRKLRLRPGDRVLEIGSGWGGWSIHAARNHGCSVTTLTVSRRQFELASRRVAEAGLGDRIDVRLQDYRDLPRGESFDRIVSIEMLEAVGHRYLDPWCRLVSRALRRDGLLALQFITCPDDRYDQFRRGVDFIQAHVFPGSLLLSVNRLNALLSRRGGFVLNSLEDLGQDYALTLRAWRGRFNARLGEVKALGFGDGFTRKWDYYLAYCEAAFALRNISVVQTVHTRANNLAFA
jgi:cyclopropane-fatty-acyl-phospholipid synthase